MSDQVGFVVRLEGGRLSEDLADFLPDYKCAQFYRNLEFRLLVRVCSSH